MDLVDDIYATVDTFPNYELFALSQQMRKAATSIPCNIAEGHGRFSLRDFRRFLREARASELELETQIIIARRRDYISEQRANDLLSQTAAVGQLVSGLIRYVSKQLAQSTKNEEQTTKTATPHTPTNRHQ